MNLTEFKQQYPQYKDTPDDKLAPALYKKFYSGKIPEDQFYQKIGYNPAPAPTGAFGMPISPQEQQRHAAEQEEGGYPIYNLIPDALTGIAKGMHLLGETLIPGYRGNVPAPQPVGEILGLPQTEGSRQGGQLVSQAASFLPTLLGSEVAIPAKLIQSGATLGAKLLGEGAKQAAQGAFYEQSIGGNPLMGAALGFAPTGGRIAAEGAVKALDNHIKEPFKKAVLSDITPRVFQKEFGTSEAPQSIMQGTENMLRQKHAGHMEEFKGLAKKSEDIAKQIDSAPVVSEKLVFNPGAYNDKLTQLKKTLNPKYDMDKIQDIDRLLAIAPKKYEDAVKLRKTINKDFDLNDVSYTARNALIESVENNINSAKNPLISEFGDTWRASNKKYAQDIAPFYEVPNKLGINKPSKDLRNSYQQGKDSEGNLVNLYNPVGAREDTLGAQHLQKLLGDEDAVREAIRAAHFKDSFVSADNGFVPKSLFLTKYEKLSPSQKNIMFKSEEQELLDVLSRQRNLSNIENGATGKGIKDKITGGLVGGAIGETLAHLIGLPPGIAGWAGGAAGAALGRNYWEKLTAGKVNRESFLKLNKEVKELNKGAEEVKKSL